MNYYVKQMFLTSLLTGLSTEYWANLIQSFKKCI